MAAIFGDEAANVVAPAVADPPKRDPAVQPSAPNSWRIIEGTEHFSLYIDNPGGPWPEFIPGYHVDSRQPSRLRGLCSPPP
jgi:hypothetical protein